MFHAKFFDGDYRPDTEGFPGGVGIAHGIFNGLLRSHANLLQKLPHRHVEIITQDLSFPDCVDEGRRSSLTSFMVRWFRLSILTLIAALSWTGQGGANERAFTLHAAPEIVESGLLQFLLPRFSLKTQVRISVVPSGDEADVSLGENGRPVFAGLGRTWRMRVHKSGHAGAEKFSDWIASDVGRRTILSFTVDGVQLFSIAAEEKVEAAPITMDGNSDLGRAVSQRLCGRCHVVVAEERMNAIGSTPSFFALRSLPDWNERFAAFYVLNPHPAFTQVAEVTPPFPQDRPPPIVPLEMTLDDVEAVLAYVALLNPADLGAPLEHQ